jgi:hypothetical protein
METSTINTAVFSIFVVIIPIIIIVIIATIAVMNIRYQSFKQGPKRWKKGKVYKPEDYLIINQLTPTCWMVTMPKSPNVGDEIVAMDVLYSIICIYNIAGDSYQVHLGYLGKKYKSRFWKL